MVMELAFFLLTVGKGAGSCCESLGAEVGTEMIDQYAERTEEYGNRPGRGAI